MPRVVLIGILCLTAAMLALETLLPRLFAVYVGPSFVYFSISVALIGLGSGGVLVATLPERFARARLSSFAAAFAVGLLAAVGCIWAGGSVLNGVIDARFAEILASPAAQVNRSLPGSAAVPSMVFVLATGLVMAVPFLLCGLCLAVAFRRYHRSARTLYAADLVGAAVGCVVAVGALQMLPLGTAFVLVAALAGLGGWLVSLGERGPGRAPVVTFGVLGALLLEDDLELLRVGRDVHGVVGATLSARAAADGVRRMLAYWEVLLRPVEEEPAAP